MGSLGHHTTTDSMRSFIVACLVALVSAEADPEAYTIAQAHALGLGVHAVNPYTNTHVAYNNAAFAPVTYNNAAFAPVAYTNAAVSPVTYANAAVNPFTYSAGIHAPLVFAAKSAPCVNAANEPVACAHGPPMHYYGKREAEAEAEPYTVQQVLTGQVAPGSVVKSINYGYGDVPANLTNVPAVTYKAVAPAVTYAHAVFPYAHTPTTYAAGIHAPTFNYAHPSYTHGLPYYG